MVLGSRRNRRLMRHGGAAPRSSARSERLAGATSDAGGWRTPPRPGGETGRAGDGRVAASAIDPALLADAAARARGRAGGLMPGYLDPRAAGRCWATTLRPVCRALTAGPPPRRRAGATA